MSMEDSHGVWQHLSLVMSVLFLVGGRSFGVEWWERGDWPKRARRWKAEDAASFLRYRYVANTNTLAATWLGTSIAHACPMSLLFWIIRPLDPLMTSSMPRLL